MQNSLGSLDAEGIAVIAASFIALLALSVSLWQGVITRKHNKVTVTPHLRFDIHIENDFAQRISVRNAGVGPAVIKNYTVHAGGSAFSFEDRKCTERALEKIGLHSLPYRAYVPDPGEYMAVSEEYTLLELPLAEPSPELVAAVQERLSGLIFEFEYESVYEVPQTARCKLP